MAASIEIGVGTIGMGGDQASAGGSNIAVGVGGSIAGMTSVGEKSAIAQGESFQSRWQSMLALLGKQSAQPATVNTEAAALENTENDSAENQNAGSAPQRATISLTGSSTGESATEATIQDAQAVAPAPGTVASQALGAKNLRSYASPASHPPMNSAVDVSGESAGRTSRPQSAPARRPGKQANDETPSKTHSSDEAISSSAAASVSIVPVHSATSATANAFSAPAPSLISTKSAADTEFAPAVTASVRPAKGSTSSLLASSSNVAGLRAGQAEQSEAAQGFTSTTETTPLADRAGISVKTSPSSPDPDAGGVHDLRALAGQNKVPALHLQAGERSTSDDDAAPGAAHAATTGASAHTTPAALHSSRGDASSEASASQGTQAVTVQPAAAVESSSLSQASPGLRGGAHAAGENSFATGATGTTGATDSRETFAALDAEPGNGAPAWLHASAQRAEAGFNDPALGWVGVRADMGPGGVHAAIVPGSADAAQTLNSHMAGLNAHLAAEHVPVESLRLATATGNEGQGAMQQGNAQNHGQSAQQQSYPDAAPVSSRNEPLNNSSASLSADEGVETAGESAQPLISYTGGAHISVIA